MAGVDESYVLVSMAKPFEGATIRDTYIRAHIASMQRYDI
jgi:hypothetical protein